MLSLGLVVALAGSANAQSMSTRVRGTIASFSGKSLVITERGGQNITLAVPDDARVTIVSNTTLADVKPGSFIGSAAVAQPDGTLKALEVHIFAESMRGSGEGNRPMDIAPQSSMTNGTVGTIAGSDGRTLTVKYGSDGEKKITVPTDVPIVSYEPGTLSLLVPGANVTVIPTKEANGTLDASRINIGKNGMKLPF
ncbi:hypothetical protein [Acidisphaera sp. L21]|uniref:hypothetical protein n=1 Tax=Acidisphaera sp. L21 TaxID=1641851 RepID=UPI001C201834|nr:hypothetical protein [Acidisphaera sp. L21]